MILRIIAGLMAAICLIALVFTDLTITQRLLLTGVVLFEAVNQWLDILAYRRKVRRDAH